MHVVFTQHAEKRMRQRDIERDTVRKALKDPDKTLNGELGRKIAHKLIKNKFLRIIYTTQNNKYIVITVCWIKPKTGRR